MSKGFENILTHCTCCIHLQKLLLYANMYSPPSRVVSLTLECLNLKYKLVEIFPLNGDTMTPEFLEVRL